MIESQSMSVVKHAYSFNLLHRNQPNGWETSSPTSINIAIVATSKTIVMAR